MPRGGAARPELRERPVDLSIGGWALLVARILWITTGLVGKAIGRILSALSIRAQDGLTLKEFVAFHGMCDFQSGLSPVMIQNLVPSTAARCRRFAKDQGIHHAVIELDNGATAHWLGPPKAARHVVLFHGGGYVTPALSHHMDMASGFATSLPRDVAIIVLQYGLVSEKANKYPSQLRQAVAVLNHLLFHQNIPPSSVILVGDSAGGHLLTSLILHLKCPNPQVPPLPLSEKLAGAAIISPWLSLFASAESMRDHDTFDIIEPGALARWAKMFLESAPSDPWNDPLTAPREWWDDLPFESIFVVFGEDELLRDSGAKLAEMLQSAHPSVSAHGVAKEIHVFMLTNRLLSLNRRCESEFLFSQWMEDRFKLS